MKPLVYVAGPITVPDPLSNAHRAIEIGDQLLRDGIVAPEVPHLKVLWQILHPHAWDVWVALDLDVVARCDAILRIVGESKGADLEIEFARARSIPVFYTILELYEWAKGEWKGRAPNDDPDALDRKEA